jgi:hypothetical protein
VHVEDGIERAKPKEFCDDGRSDGGREDLRAGCSSLWCEDAHPDLLCFGSFGPELKKPLEIPGLVCNLAGDGAVDRNARLRKVLQYTLVGRRCATYIVFGLQAVDGDDNVEALKCCPMSGDGAEGAGDNLGMNAATVKFGEDRFELAIADEGIAADEGYVERLVLVDYAEDVFDQGVLLVVGQLAKGDGAVTSEVGWIVGVASGAAEGAFSGDLDGERRTLAQKNGLPCLHYF